MKVSALIPAKGFANAKQRLSQLLRLEEREILAEAMFRDVLRQVLSARGLEESFVVTGDAKVSEIATAFGTRVIREEKEQGETEAVVFALEEVKRRTIEIVLILPGDIPLIHSSDVELLLEHASEYDLKKPFALLVPSHDRMGTNGLLLSPPDVIRLRFGYDSFSYHLRQVAARRLPLRVVENERIGLDIDEPKDLERFIEFAARLGPNESRDRIPASARETYSRLRELGIVDGGQKTQRSEGL